LSVVAKVFTCARILILSAPADLSAGLVITIPTVAEARRELVLSPVLSRA
jgi:hypothetical protein